MTKQHVNGYCPHCNEPATLDSEEIDQCDECGRYYHSDDLARRRLLIEAAPDLLKVAREAAENAAIVTDLLLTPGKVTPEEMVNVITSLGRQAREAINKAEEG